VTGRLILRGYTEIAGRTQPKLGTEALAIGQSYSDDAALALVITL
jgi:hypothetical protein